MIRTLALLAVSVLSREINVHVLETSNGPSEFMALRDRALRDIQNISLTETAPGIAGGIRAQTQPGVEFHLFPPREDTEDILRSIDATKRIHEELQKASVEHVVDAFRG